MEVLHKTPNRAWVPFALLALFYLGGLWQRPMFDMEYPFALWAGQSVPGYFQVRHSAIPMRLPGAAATLLTAGALYLFMQKRSRETGGMAAGLFLATGNVYAAGTAADSAPFFTLGLTVLLLALADFAARKKALYLAGIAAGAGMLWYSAAKMPPPAFRLEHWGYFVIGLFPVLLILPPVFTGFRQMKFQSVPERIALLGLAVGLAVLKMGELTAAMPFLALLAALALEHYGALDAEHKRLNTLFRHWFRTALACAVLLLAGFFAVKSGKVKPFPLPNNMVMSVFAVMILMLWLYMAQKETRLLVKVTYFALGSAFLLTGLPAFLPNRVIAAHTPAEFIRKCWPPDADGVSLRAGAVPDLEYALVYADVCNCPEILPPEKMAARAAGGGIVFLVHEADSRKLPSAYRKIVLRGADLAILEYR